MTHALLINMAAFGCFAFLVCWVRYRLERTRQHIDELHGMRATSSAGAGRS
jgi:hypothetical protein